MKMATGEEPEQPNAVLNAEQILELQAIVRKMPVSDHVFEYARQLVRVTRVTTDEALPLCKKWLSWGAGPRAGLNLIMAAKALAPENREGFVRLRAEFSSLENFEAEAIEAALKALAEELGVKVRDLVMPARLACTGVKVGPSLYDLMTVLGREKVLARFDRALAQMG